MRRDEEREALDTLAEHLRAEGETITVLRRPDEEIRDRRAVDFEVEWNGSTVGVEVTSASAYTADFVIVEQFEDEVEERLRPIVEARHLGTIVVHFSYDERPRRRDVPELVERVVEAVSNASLGGDLESFVVPNPPPPIEGLEVTRLRGARDVVGRISSPIPGWWVQDEVDQFVDKLISGKGTQGDAYDIVWLLIFERTPILSATELAAGLQRRRETLPGNWQRIFYTADKAVTEVFRGDDAHA